jgi:hypothetical protein
MQQGSASKPSSFLANQEILPEVWLPFSHQPAIYPHSDQTNLDKMKSRLRARKATWVMKFIRKEVR